MKREKKFRIRSKSYFLTQPNCGLSPEEGKEKIEEIIKKEETNLSLLLIGQEKHKDESKEHLHCYLELKKTFRTQNPFVFDLKSSEKKKQHGNYQSARNKRKVINQILKKGKKVWICEKIKKRLVENEQLSVEETIIYLSRKGDLKGAMDLYEKEKPKEFLKNHISMEKSLQILYKRKKEGKGKQAQKSFKVPEKVKKWFETSKNKEKSLWVSGESGLGKTQLIISLCEKQKLRVLRVTHKENLHNFSAEDHDIILFDDQHFPGNREDKISLVDSSMESTIEHKWGHKEIPKKVQKVFLSNQSPEEKFKLKEDGKRDPIRRRIQHVEVKKALFL